MAMNINRAELCVCLFNMKINTIFKKMFNIFL